MPHLGGGEVLGGDLGLLASIPLDARELLKLSGREFHEAETGTELALGDGSVLRGPAVRAVGTVGGGIAVSEGEEAEAKDKGLQHQEDQKIGQVEGEHLRGGGGSGKYVKSLFFDVGSLLSVGGGKARGHNDSTVEVVHLDAQQVNQALR